MLSLPAFQNAMSLSPASIQHRDEPVHGWKLALLVKDARNVMFRAISRHAFYTAGRQRFICQCPDAQFPPILRAPHQKPTVGDGSSCGWYAMKDKHDCLQAYNTRMACSPDEMNAWLLEVDLWGTVIEGERGYRGEYQRVLSVQPAGRPEMTTTHQNQLYLMGTRILYRPIYQGLMVPPMKPVLRVADLASKLGTEVLWSDLAASAEDPHPDIAAQTSSGEVSAVSAERGAGTSPRPARRRLRLLRR
jgi:hypothetical protein